MANSATFTTGILFTLLTIIAVYGSVSAVKCYVCDSSMPTCLENVFVALGTTTQDDCTCCKKTVSDDRTSRDCASGLASISCIPTDSNHVCASDLCNAASRLDIGATLAAAIFVLVRNLR